DLATWIGFLAAMGMCFWSLWRGAGGNLGVFWDQPSAILVFGGTLFVVLMTQAVDRYFGLWRVIKRAFFSRRQSSVKMVDQIVKLGEIARREGVLSLESALKDIDDEFLANGVRLVIDGTGAAEIEQILSAELDAADSRHSQGKAILDSIAKYAPAFGMIGTLMGLVAMLNNMD